ncbi:MAG: phosphate ABC transporter ATP-binding protein [bacterium]
MDSVESLEFAIQVDKLNSWYGDFQALFDVDLEVKKGSVTSLIGPSGCGKSTLLRSINRINERLGSYTRISGTIRILDHDILDESVDLSQLRKRVGMVFQRPNPLPLSIRDNVLFAHRIHGSSKNLSKREEERILEDSLRTVLLWDDVKDRLGRDARGLSLEAQQKLCIARLIPLKPSVILMDEPTSALDPKGTEALEQMIWTLAGEYTILIVTHNMAQARRASTESAFMLLGKLVEKQNTGDLFLNPIHQQTADYIEGRYG